MGQRQDFIKQTVYKKYAKYKHPKLTVSELNDSNFFNVVADVYRKLDGQLIDIPVKYGSWDISTTNFIIEVDEERHFNRYRLETLSSVFYTDYIHFPLKDYQNFCVNKEKKCLKTAGWEKTGKMILLKECF